MISFQKEKDNYMLAKFPFILTFPGLYAPAMLEFMMLTVPPKLKA